MPKSRPAYPAASREQLVELVRAGRRPEDLSRGLEPTAQTIHNWVAQADRHRGRRSTGERLPAFHTYVLESKEGGIAR